MSGHSDDTGGASGMGGGKAPKGKAADAARRDQRLKAALKANMGRRKAQARARADGAPAESDGTGTDGDTAGDTSPLGGGSAADSDEAGGGGR